MRRLEGRQMCFRRGLHGAASLRLQADTRCYFCRLQMRRPQTRWIGATLAHRALRLQNLPFQRLKLGNNLSSLMPKRIHMIIAYIPIEHWLVPTKSPPF